MTQVSKDAEEILSFIAAKKITNPAVLTEIFVSLGSVIFTAFRSSKVDPVALAFIALSGTLPLLRASQVGTLEEALSGVIGLCGECRDSADCGCARKLKLFGMARALGEEIAAFSESPEVKHLLAEVRQS